MLAAPRDTQRALIDAYPDLLAAPAALAEASDDARAEYAAAGLADADPAVRAALAAQAADYRARYGV